MIDQASLRAVEAQKFGPNFVKPIYKDYGFAQIPQTVRYLLTDDKRKGVPFGDRDDLYDRYDTVILFFIDAFGWKFVERFAERSPFLQRIAREGLVSKITSQFPSTTAAHVTTIHTGLPVGQSGVYEWFYYEPQLDAIIAPLLFSFAGDHDRDTLAATGIDPTRLFPSTSIYQDLANHGVHSTILQDKRYVKSPYTKVVTNGAKLVPYRTFPEAIASLWERMQHQSGKNYYFLYYDKIDSVCHQHGPDSIQLEAEIQVFLDTMESLFHTNIGSCRGRTLFLMTADHAQVGIDPKTTFYLNREMPELLPLLRRNRAGQILAPAGSTRDVFLSTREDLMDDAVHMLQQRLHGRADVCRTDDLMERCFFGESLPSAALLGRIGDLVILPYAGESVWWYEKGRFEQNYYGSHGGLTADEMETVLLVQPYGG